MKTISICFRVLAAVLSHAMCGAVAFYYCDMLWGIRCAGYSAPASTAFLLAIPFVVGIGICIALALIFRKKAARSEDVH